MVLQSQFHDEHLSLREEFMVSVQGIQSCFTFGTTDQALPGWQMAGSMWAAKTLHSISLFWKPQSTNDSHTPLDRGNNEAEVEINNKAEEHIFVPATGTGDPIGSASMFHATAKNPCGCQ